MVHRSIALVAFTLLYTALNAAKPITIDDTAYYYYARQIADDPTDPYGHQVFWYQSPEPANEVLAPPVLLYWWGLGLRLLGDDPTLWKWWLLPFSALLVVSVHALARRFARGTELWLTAMIVFSPALLPSLNLMLDVPALALALSALCVFIAATEGRSWRCALGAGVLAGLAMQMKYTGLLVPPLLFLYALPRRGLRLWLVSVCVAVGLFAGWEWFVAWRYGESHFLHHLGQKGDSQHGMLQLATRLPVLVGSVTMPLLLLGVSALNVPRWARGLVWILSASIYATVGMYSVEFEMARAVRLEWILFAGTGVVLWGMLAYVLFRALPRNRDVWFLGLWLALEVAGFFMLTPFPAVRRILGLVLVQTLILGRLVSRVRRRRPVPMLWAVVAASVTLGLFYWVVDWRGARTHQRGVEEARQWIGERDGRVWYVGHWGFQFYAERSGMRPLVPDESFLREGDWVIRPDRIDQQRVLLDGRDVRKAGVVTVMDPLPYQTVHNFYAGSSGLLHGDDNRLNVEIYCVLRDFVPRRD